MKTKLKRSHFNALIYLAVSAFCGVFGVVYEAFSHGVYSPFMMYAFLIPFALGFVPFLLIGLLKGIYPNKLSMYLYNSGVAFLTVGSLMQGVLEIYGTTNVLMTFYPIIGGVLLVNGIAVYLIYTTFRKLSTR